MSDTVTESASAAADETPVSVELNHRGGPASLAVIHVGGQQAYDVAAVSMQADADEPGPVTMTLTSAEGETTTVRVLRMDVVGEVQP